MARIPEPDHTAAGPAYQGRLLDRPREEVVDQGAPFDVRTLISRRGVLGLVGAGVGAMALAACSSGSSASGTSTVASTANGTPTGEIPDETAGPYPGDGSNGPDVLEQTGIVRSDIRTSIGSTTAVEGVPLTFKLTVLDQANDDAPFKDVAVYAWHCDKNGDYSMYSEGVEDETWLRGVQVADADGVVSFKSIFPACYTGRWPHIHFEVYPDVDSITDAENAIATSQIALPEEQSKQVYALDTYGGSTDNLSQVTLDSDNVFGDDGAELQLATITGSVEKGFTASLVVRVDTSTEPAGGGAPPEGGNGGPPGER